jgi:Na+-transporting NADH:ubiquinone oxidoreductase subunit C
MRQKNIMPESIRLPHGHKDSVKNTVTVALLVSLVCSVLVSTTAVLLKPRHLENQLFYGGYRNILQLVETIQQDISIEDALRRIDIKIVDLATGEYVEDLDVSQYDQREAAKDPVLGIPVPEEFDIANIGRRAKFATVYLLKENSHIKYVILPVHGSGMWSTLYGYLALEADGNTIAGLKFHEHGETPGLGDKVDDSSWLRQWRGKTVYDNGVPAIKVARRNAPPDSKHQVDGLAGATLTGQGVTNLLQYWLGEHGFQPYLERFHNKRE